MLLRRLKKKESTENMKLLNDPFHKKSSSKYDHRTHNITQGIAQQTGKQTGMMAAPALGSSISFKGSFFGFRFRRVFP